MRAGFAARVGGDAGCGPRARGCAIWRSTVDTTIVTIDGQQARLEDLQPGAKVKASYDQQDGRDVASTLDVQK